MRNLKRALSLALASVMLLGMMVVGSSAASYPDVDENNNIEAIDVLEAVEVMVGYPEDGGFHPDDNVTRNEIAVILAKLIKGSDADNYVGICPFTDVPEWAQPYVACCYDNNIVAGRGAGIYDGDSTVTAQEAAAMVMRVLGYLKLEGTGADWARPVVSKANSISLFDGVASSVTAPLNRNQVAQLALNALESTMVEMSDNTLSVETSVGGATTTVTGGQIDYVARADGNESVRNAINRSKQTVTNSVSGVTGPTLELGEFLYQGDLKKLSSLDDYGRPSDTWSWKNIEIGTYAHEADFIYTDAAAGDTNVDKVKDMGLNNFYIGEWDTTGNGTNDTYTLLTVNGLGHDADGSTTVDVPTDVDASGEITFGSGNGLVRTTDEDVAALLANFVKNGTVVEVYLDGSNANVISHIAVTQTQVMQVNRVTAQDVTLKTVESEGINAGAPVPVAAVKSDEYAYDILKDLESDDYVVVTPLLTSANTYSVDDVYVPETVEGNLTRVDLNKSGTATGVALDGEPYKMSHNWTADGGRGTVSASSVSDRQTSRAYLDAYGYVIFMEDVVARDDFIIFDEWRSSLVGGNIHYIATGWNLNGDELELDMGTRDTVTAQVTNNDSGKVYAYALSTNNNNADYVWNLTSDRIFTMNTGAGTNDLANNIQAVSASTIAIGNADTNAGANEGRPYYLASGVKTVFLTFDSGTGVQTVDTVTVKSGAQKLSDNLVYQCVLNGNDQIKGIVVRSDKDVEVSQNILYVERQTSTTKDSSGKTVSIVTAWIGDEKIEKVELNKQVTNDTFWTYRVNSDGVYEVNGYTNRTDKSTSVLEKVQFNSSAVKSKAYLPYEDIIDAPAAVVTNLDLTHGTKVIDLRAGGTLASIADMVDDTKYGSSAGGSYTVSLIYNDTQDGTSEGRVSYLYITDASESPAEAKTVRIVVGGGLPIEVSADGVNWDSFAIINNRTGTLYIRAKEAGNGKVIRISAIDLDGFEAVTDLGNGVYSLEVEDNDGLMLFARAGTTPLEGVIVLGVTDGYEDIQGYILEIVALGSDGTPLYTLEAFGGASEPDTTTDEDGFFSALLDALKSLDGVTEAGFEDGNIRIKVGDDWFVFDPADAVDKENPGDTIGEVEDGAFADMMPSGSMNSGNITEGEENEPDEGTVAPKGEADIDISGNPAAGADQNTWNSDVFDEETVKDTEGKRSTMLHITLDLTTIINRLKAKLEAAEGGDPIDLTEYTLVAISHNNSLTYLEGEKIETANQGIGINEFPDSAADWLGKTDVWNLFYVEDEEAPHMDFFLVKANEVQSIDWDEYVEGGVTPGFVLHVDVSGITFPD